MNGNDKLSVRMLQHRKIFLSVLALVPVVSLFISPNITAPSQIVQMVRAQSLATPIHLTIPNAHVDTNIIDVGITPKGNLDVPGNYTEVGWYKYGTRPGQIGSTVLDGHVDNGGDIPGPFKHLRDLKIGDTISVTMSDGEVLTYKVTVTQAYPLKKFPADMVFNETGREYLKIITCHGKYVPSIKTYNQRLIVTAVRSK